MSTTTKAMAIGVTAVVSVLLVSVLLAACGDGSSKGTALGGRADADPTTTSGSDGPLQQLAGRYAHYDVVAYQSTDMKTLIISYGFTDLDVRNGKLMATESFCHAEHRSDQPIKTTMSDAATSAIKPVSVAVEVSAVDGRTRLQRPETPTGIGIHLADPANDPLPTDPDDPRIADDDGDGHPGVTAHVEVTPELQGDIYLARREIFAYDVTRNDDRSLTGTVSDHSEQLIIGASNPIFVTTAAWTQVPDLTKSPIILRPVERSWNCSRLMAARDELFPPTPSVDW